MQALAAQLSQIIEEVNHSFTPELDWEYRPAPEKWSGKQILGHLIDSAQNNIQRFIRATYEQEFRFVYNQNEWVRHQQYKQADISEVFQLWTLLNKQIVRIWENYPTERAAVLVDVGQQAPEMKTIREIAEAYITHLKHHLAQIDKITTPDKSVAGEDVAS